jgi:orotidine-5'-phosphate decarboxylase
MSFIEKLRNRWQSANSLLCVGLDPELAKASPAHLRSDHRTRCSRSAAPSSTPPPDLVCAFKPQIAHFAALGGKRRCDG